MNTRPSGSTNRLAGAASPYLRQHADNPVDWYPWGAEAFERARREDRPVFLSVGYSSCHWCHVMAHESFENEAVAQLMNERFVCVKVDREERPDVDEVYLRVTQLLTRSGGWPNSVWLTPDGRPWFAGTYFPLEDRPGAPGFASLCRRLGDLWQHRRAEVERQADEITAALRRWTEAAPAEAPPTPPAAWVDAALAELRRAFDAEHGGFGGAPKFPPHGELALLLAEHRRRDAPDLLEMATATLDAMARGGIHDRVGGGFHRYATDERWFLPHFEKMLYDNARLLGLYAEAWARTQEVLFERAAWGIGDWVLREMTSPDGGFYSALDADSADGEGRYYQWTPSELQSALGSDDGVFVARVLGVAPGGNVRDEATGRRTGANILYLPHPVAELAAMERMPADLLLARLQDCCERLRIARARRPPPGLDDKVLTGWNGLMIGGLARAGAILGEQRFIEAARRAAGFVTTHLRVDGRLHRVWVGGRATIEGYLDDHAYLALGLVDLFDATGEEAWRDAALELTAEMIRLFRDTDRGGFYFTSAAHEPLLTRVRDPYDNALPSANAVACVACRRLYSIAHIELFRVTADETLRAFATDLGRAPRAAPTFLLAVGLSEDVVEETPPPVSLRADDPQVVPGETGCWIIPLRVAIAHGFHVAAGDADAVRVELAPHSGAVLEHVALPVVRGSDAEAGAGSDGWTKEVEVSVRVRCSPAAGKGPPLEFRVTLQVCDPHACLPPVTLSVRVDLPPREAPGGGC